MMNGSSCSTSVACSTAGSMNLRFNARLNLVDRSRRRTAATRCAEVPVRLRTGRATPKWLIWALPADCGVGTYDSTPQGTQDKCQDLRHRGVTAADDA